MIRCHRLIQFQKKTTTSKTTQAYIDNTELKIKEPKTKLDKVKAKAKISAADINPDAYEQIDTLGN